MQDKHVFIHTNQERTLSVSSQRLVEHLEDLWQTQQVPSFETLKQILLDLPEPYKAMGIAAIAELLVNDMKLHFLEIVATFYQKAEQEGIGVEERDETLQDVEVEAFRLMQLSKQILVRSLDDLLLLSNATRGLHALSKVKDAETAQSWMYKLPTMYLSKVEQEHLTAPIKFEVLTSHHPKDDTNETSQ